MLRTVASLSAVSALFVIVAGVGPAPVVAARAASAPVRAAGNTLTTSSAVTKSARVGRYYVGADGTKSVIDDRTVSVTVETTTNLRSLQLLNVTWTGAHPTGGIVGDPNSDKSQNQEYPMALFECRGVDSTAVAEGQRLSPQTCWTQFSDERFLGNTSSFPAWRSDAAAANTDRADIVGSPAPSVLPARCTQALSGVQSQRWVPFVGADGTNYAGGPQGCAGQPPEAASSNLSSLALPSNETFGVTGLDGSGQANFDTFTSQDHASLGCSQTVPCSLVAIPIEGVNCDSAGTLVPAADQPGPNDLADATSSCQTAGNFKPGQLLPAQGSGQSAVDGRLWWSASNWDNRITIPLTFAQPDNVCSIADSRAPTNVYGSELMIQATTQWAPHFCLDPKLFNFNHVQTGEPEARNLLSTGNVQAAFASEPPGTPYSKPIVQAPTAVTGFGIAFTIDDAKLKRLTHLNLDARLLAKLLTLSYPDTTFVRDAYSALAGNPLNLTYDPEFQALNPGIPQQIIDGAATLLTLNSDSDLVYALTSYINADTDARAWLDGAPDPWGMVINPNYRKIALPVNNWPINDSFEPLNVYTPGHIDCLYADPLPYLPLVAAPTARLFSIGQDVEFAISQSQTVCSLPSPIPGSLAGAKMVAFGRQAVGFRFMLGTVSLGDAAREGLTVASLETQRTQTSPDKFTDSTGRTFIAPDVTGLKLAASLLKPDATSGTWPVPYAAMRTSAAGAQAYPGTMVVYTDVPTSGLPKADAGQFANLLTFAAGVGQIAGLTPGTLPDGYLPMTAANGLASLAAYTNRAAAAVAAQQGTVPSVVGSGNVGGATSPSKSSASSSQATAGIGHGLSGNSITNTVGAATSPGSKAHSPNPTSSAVISLSQTRAAAHYTSNLATGIAGAILPALACLAIIAAGLSIAMRLRARGQRR